MFSRTRRCRGARHLGVAAGVTFALLAAGAYAQPGHHGSHGFGGEPLAEAIARYKAELALNTSQQMMWDSAIAATREARLTGRTLRQQVHDAMVAELAKPEPDLAAVAAAADAAQAKGQALRRQIRDQWLALYATFTPAQKAVVRDVLQQKVKRHERMHERMRERSGQ